MWFAALGPQPEFAVVLTIDDPAAGGSPAVEHLLAKNPFPINRPALSEQQLYDYRFSDVSVRRANGCDLDSDDDGRVFPRGPTPLAGSEPRLQSLELLGVRISSTITNKHGVMKEDVKR
jgi:hypothetical protein